MEVYALLVLCIVQITAAHQSLRLTVIDQKNISDVKAEQIVSLVTKLDNPKAEASRSKEMKAIIMTTEDEELRIDITDRLVKELNIPQDSFTVEILPDIEMKGSYRRHSRSVSKFDLNAFNTHESVNAYLDNLADDNPDLVTTETIGYSYQDRPIKIVKISLNNDALKPKVFFDGAQHAREWIAPAVLLYITHKLIAGYRNNDKKLKPLVEQYEFHILPILNPDGYAFTYAEDGIRLWRKNMKNTTHGLCTGVDLNRNWDFHWSGRGGSTDKCSLVYQGEAAFSEIETLAAAQYIMSHHGEWHSYFSFHSYGQMILFPYSHTSVPGPDYSKHIKAGRVLAEGVKSVNARSYTVGPVGLILYEAAGSSESWAYSIGIPYTYTIELPDRYSFIVPTDVIEPTATEWVTGLVDYFTYIESADSNLYAQLVDNITLNLPPSTAAPKADVLLSTASGSSSVVCSTLYLYFNLCLIIVLQACRPVL